MKRIPELDAVRGIAATGIVLYHLGPLFRSGNGFLRHVHANLPSFVNVFFVISGFLITSILLRQTDAGNTSVFRGFYIRRILRIWPLYYFVMISRLVFGALFLHERYDPVRVINNLTFTQFVEAYVYKSVPIDGHPFATAWSIAVEEQFYLFWPLAIVVFGRRRLAWPIVFFIATAIVMRMLGYMWLLLGCQCDALALGAALPLILPDKRTAQATRTRVLLFFMALVGFGITFSSFRASEAVSLAYPTATVANFFPSLWVFSGNLTFCAIIGLIVSFSETRYVSILRNPVLCYLGTISYGIYLYHAPVILTLQRLLHRDSGFLFFGLGLVVPICVAALSWHLYEQPILKIKERFPYRTRRAIARDADDSHTVALESKTSTNGKPVDPTACSFVETQRDS